MPSVLVCVYALHEASQSTDPLQASSGPAILEKEKDQLICNDINERRRQCAERGIEFAAVIMLRLHLPSDAAIEERMAYIKRSAQLQPKNLFILPPLPGIPGTSATPSSPWLIDAGDFITQYAFLSKYCVG